MSASSRAGFGPSQGIRVKLLCPGPVETPLLLRISRRPRRVERRRIHWPMAGSRAAEVVNGALFLA